MPTPGQKRDAERAHDKNTEFFHNVNKAAIETSYVALRTAVLINGGAAVAVLAFLGSLASGNRVQISQLSQMASSLKLFAWGVASAAFAMVTAYLTNYFIASRVVSREPTFSFPY